jgi:hypothetical protein
MQIDNFFSIFSQQKSENISDLTKIYVAIKPTQGTLKLWHY